MALSSGDSVRGQLDPRQEHRGGRFMVTGEQSWGPAPERKVPRSTGSPQGHTFMAHPDTPTACLTDYLGASKSVRLTAHLACQQQEKTNLSCELVKAA